ncbi:hypothetical protein NM208_g1266 [Fusarium decemcellulare]|uniref:Uncharacterized protein n=1 Tax=Fusarium decemcellulare TaxID=57161 RepID=A0ACC1SWZ5_9HYPO|nr:hypothetical protein NM208_g1266 [Fusarium decemcellulare]
MPRGDFEAGAADYAKIADVVSGRIASATLKQLPPLRSNSSVLDLACGNGAVTNTVIKEALAEGHDPPPAVLGLDLAQSMINLYQQRADSNSWGTVSSKVQDAQNLLGIPNNEFDLVFMNFGIMYTPNASQCAREVYRVLKPGGYAVFTTWKEAGIPQLMGRASAAVGSPPAMSPMDNGWNTKEKLLSIVHDGGFRTDDVEIKMIQTQWEGGSADGIIEALSAPFWNPLHDGTSEATSTWQKALRENLTPEQKKTGSVDMLAWACLAKKGEILE